jgi:hypothetical protein
MFGFDLDNENGFYCLYHFLLSAYIYCRKNNQILYLKDTPYKFSYEKGWDDFFLFNDYIVKYNPDKHTVTQWFGHMREPPEQYTLHEYKQYSKELYILQPTIVFPTILPANETYNSIFIRGGDKLLYEARRYHVSLYISLLVSLQSATKNLFVHSDDNTIVEEVEQYIHANHLDFRVYKITNARTNGGTVVMKRLRYGPCSNIVSVDEMNKEEKKEHLMEMRHAIEIMRRSQNVIVSFDSNVSRFMKVTFDCNVYSVQHTNTVSFDTPTINPAFGF